MCIMKRNLIIVLCLVLCVMPIGYSSFSSRLDIDSSSAITSSWNVEITSIDLYKKNGNVSESNKPTFTKDTANFSVLLELPGDYVYYKIGITNKGSLPAIATLGSLECSKSNAIGCGAYGQNSSFSSSIGVNEDLTGQRLVIDKGETEYFIVWVNYNGDYNIIPDNKKIDFKLSLVYRQSDVGVTHKNNCFTSKVLKDGTLSITDYDKTCGSDVVIPEEIDGYKVTQIADGKYESVSGAFTGPFYNKGITSVTFPDTITYIGYVSFKNNKITNLVLPGSLKTIAVYAFNGNGMQSVQLNEGINVISNQAFSRNSLTSVTIPASVTSIGTVAFAYNNISSIIYEGDPSLIKFSGGVFTGNALTGEEAFIYDYKNGEIDYTSLNSYAGKTATYIPDTVQEIRDYAFSTVNFANVVLPNNVLSIGSFAFDHGRVKSVKFNDGLLIINHNAFQYNDLTEIFIPDSVETIDSEAFLSNKLTKVKIGSGIKSIGIKAFCTSYSGGIYYNPIETFTINRKEGSVSGSPWGSNATIKWLD